MWARRNEDKLPPDDCNYNLIHHQEDISEESGSAGEPVTLQEVKDYLRLEGTFDDILIGSMIIEARMYVEKITGIHLVNKHLVVVLSNGAGLIDLPGPVSGSITVTDIDGNSITPVQTIGTFFPKLREPTGSMIKLTYWAGYNGDAPVWAKNAILAYIADHYEYRGDDAPPAANKRCNIICKPHSKLSAWA